MYSLGIYIYILFVRLASLFGHRKAKQMLVGHKQTISMLKKKLKPGNSYVWFHVASCGGFEQSRPMIEHLRATHPEYRVVLTFFSPSGYEVAKDYQLADAVCFMPFDTRRNVKLFLDVLKPEMAFFVKCEFWLNFLTELKRRSIPIYSISSIFADRRSMLGVSGGRLRLALHCFTHLFVQDEKSREILATIGVRNVSVVGNTRFDRVIKVLEQSRQIPLLEIFSENGSVFVAGASEKDDEAVYIPFFNSNKGWKLIISPKCLDDECIKSIEKQFEGTCVRYTRATMDNIHNADCVIIDSCELKSIVYRYGDIAFVGGSFGKGVHNVLEAAVYGVPLLIGPECRRSPEAQGLFDNGGALKVNDAYDFGEKMRLLCADKGFAARIGAAATEYVKNNAGATTRIYNRISF